MAHRRMQPYRRCPVSLLIIPRTRGGRRHKKSIPYVIQTEAEVDFVAGRTDERLYIQVCYVLTPENMDREFGPLEAIPDNYEKLVLPTDTLLRINRGGIRQKNIMDFLPES